MQDSDRIPIGGIIESRDLVMVAVHSAPNQPGVAGKVLNLMGENGVNVEFITESSNIENCADISFCFKSSQKLKVEAFFQKLRSLVKAQGEKWIDDVGIVSIYGPHFREKPAIAGKMCSALGAADINILGISTSISTVSCVVKNDKIPAAKEAILTQFKLPQ